MIFITKHLIILLQIEVNKMIDHNQKKVSLRGYLHEKFAPYTPGQSSKASLWIDLMLIVAIIASSLLVPLEHFHPEYVHIFWQLEICFTVIFVVEYGIRWYSAQNRLIYPFTPFALIDLIAILPTILMLSPDFILLRMFRGVRLLRVLRLLRLLRLLKFLRYGFLIYRGMIDLKIKMSDLRERYNLSHIGKLLFYTVIIWFLGANILYFTETHFGNGTGPFSNYWKSYWHIVIVLISGIEDKEPYSVLGRVEITMLLIAGICFVGIVTGEIVSILVKQIQRAGKIPLKPRNCVLKHHIVILGQNNHLYNIIRQVNAGLKGNYYIIVVSETADEIKIHPGDHFKKLFAFPANPLAPATLDQLNLPDAFRVIILSENHTDNHTLMKTVATYSRNPSIPMVVELKESDTLNKVGALTHPDFMISQRFGEQLISQAVLTPGVTQIYKRLMTFTNDSNEFYVVSVPSFLVGKRFKEAQLHFLDHDDEAIIVIGIDRSPQHAPCSNFLLNPPGKGANPELQIGDHLILIAFEQPILEGLNQEELWNGRILS